MWFVVAGLGLAVSYLIAGVICCVLIVTIPFGLQAFKIAGYVIWPFGRSVIAGDTGAGSALGNVVWFIVAGWWVALAHVVAAAFLAVTIIGLPWAVVSLRMATLAVAPFGKVIVPSSQVAVGAAIVTA